MRLTLLILIFGFGKFVFCQTSFAILDEQSKAPIVGAKIELCPLEKGENCQLLRSDALGGFDVPDSTKRFYTITAVGYDTLQGELRAEYELLLKSSNLFDEVVVTAQYQPSQKSNAIQKINVISVDQIERSGANNLADILNYQTGTRLSNDNILGTSLDLSGVSGQNVKILIDGVPVIGRLDGDIDLSQINLNNIERIEIVEGPLSVNYGTDALGGTINLITKKAGKDKLTIGINPYYESVGNYNLSGSAGYQTGKHSFYLSGGRNYFDGWTLNDPFFQFPKSRLADTNRFKIWKPKEQYFGEFRYTGMKNNWTWSPYFRFFKEVIINRGYPIAPYVETALDDYYHTNRTDVGLNLNKEFKKSKLNIIAAYNIYNRIKNTYYKDLTTLEQQLSQTEGAQDTSKFDLINLRATYAHQFNEKISIESGLDLNQESAVGKRIENNIQHQGDYAAYFSAEWNVWKGLKLKPGLRYAYNTVYESPLVPSFNVLFKHKKLSLRGYVARGFRAPTLKELYFDFVDINHNIVGNQELRAEYSMNYGVSLNWIKPLQKKDYLKFEYNAFYNDICNLITLGLIENNQYTYLNIGEYSTVGNRFSVSYHHPKIECNLSSSYIGRYNLHASDNPEISQFSFSPEVSVNLGWNIIPDRLKFNTFYKYNGILQSFSIDSENEIIQSQQSDYHILDAGFAGYFIDKSLTINLGAKNLLGVTAVNITGTTGGVHGSSGSVHAGRGRSIFVSIKYNFEHGFKKKEK